MWLIDESPQFLPWLGKVGKCRDFMGVERKRQVAILKFLLMATFNFDAFEFEVHPQILWWRKITFSTQFNSSAVVSSVSQLETVLTFQSVRDILVNWNYSPSQVWRLNEDESNHIATFFINFRISIKSCSARSFKNCSSEIFLRRLIDSHQNCTTQF